MAYKALAEDPDTVTSELKQLEACKQESASLISPPLKKALYNL